MKELKKENAKLNEKVRELTQENETLSTNEKELNNLQKLLKIIPKEKLKSNSTFIQSV